MQLSLDLSTSPLEAVRDGLIRIFGPQRPTRRLDPVSQLVKSSISGRTKDATSWAVYHRLKERFSTWEELADAPDAEVQALIKEVTYPEEKAVTCPTPCV